MVDVSLLNMLREWWRMRRAREELTEQYRHETEDPRMPETWGEWDFLKEDDE